MQEIFEKVAQDLGMPKADVEKIYKMYWKAIREYVSSLPLKDDLSDDEFNMLKPNVNIPSIGKFNVTLDRYKNIKKCFKQRKEKKDNATHKED